MDINVKVKKNLQIRAFYLFFIISAIQLGVGLMGVPRLIFLEAIQDSWISILIAFLYIIAVLIVMLIILGQYENADIYGIQVDIFGNWIGKLFGSIYILHFSIALLSILVTYIEVVRIYIFPTMSNLVMGFLLLCLVIYSVLGGLRVIVGICTIFFFLTHWLLFLLIQPAMQFDPTHIQPMFSTPIPDLLNGAKVSAYTFMGFEILFLVYPFIRNKEKAKVPTFLAATWSTFVVLLVTVLVIGFFTLEEIKRREWVLLSLFKLQSFSFIERFDYVVVANWMIVVIPNMILLMWGITYGIKRMYHIPQKATLYIVSFILLIACIFFDEHYRIQKLINISGDYGTWLVYVYPFILLPIVLIKKRRKKKENNKHVKAK